MSLGTDILGIKMCSAREVLALPPCGGAPALLGSDCSLRHLWGVGGGVLQCAVHPRHSLPSTRYCPLAVPGVVCLLWARACADSRVPLRPGVFPLRTVLVLVSECDALLAPLYGEAAGCSRLGLQHRGGAPLSLAQAWDQASSWRRARRPERPLEQHRGQVGTHELHGELHGKRFLGASCMYRLWEGRTIKGK